MPNEFKPLQSASALASKTKKFSQLGSSTVSMTLWTISGIVLAACANAPVLDAVTGATITDNASSDADSTVTTGSLTGTLVGTDVNAGDVLTYAAERDGVTTEADDTVSLGEGINSTHRVDGAYGNLYYNEGTGDYVFVPNEVAINALNTGDNENDTFTVSVSDQGGLTSATREIVFTVVGADEANNIPVLNAVTGATITDNAASDTGSTVAGSLTGTLTGTDADTGDTLIFAASSAVDDTSKSGYDHRVDGSYGDLYYNEGSGAYIFERDEAAINALGAGQNVNDTFTVSVSDQGGLTSASRALVFSVDGANDAPILNAVTGATITDNAASATGSTVTPGSLTGTLAGTDVDTGDTLTFAVSTAVGDTSKTGYDHRVDGTYGDLYYNEGSGAYIFERDEAAINALDAAQNVTDSFTVSVSDGSLTSATRALVFTVVGVNDAPVLNAVTGATISDNAASDTGSTVAGSLTGTLAGTDVDAGDAASLVFAASNAVGDTSKGGYDHRVDGTYGKLYYNEGTGAYIFERDEAAINVLGATQNVNDTFTVSVSDGNLTSASRALVFTVNGANDAPVLNAVTGATITDNATSDTGSTVAGSLTGTLAGTDVDTGDAAGLTFAANGATGDTSKTGYDHRVDGTYGDLYYNEGSGAYIFERDEAAINALNATQNVNDTFTVSVSDQGGLTSASRALVFTVVGGNDAPVLNAVTGATITDNAASATGSTVAGSLTGTLAGTDVDTGDAAGLTFAASNATDDTSKTGYDHRVDGTYGDLYYNESSGAYIFERDEAAINAVDAGQNVNDTFTVSVSDQGGASSASRALVFTVNGVNDAPVLNAVTGATITDNTASTTGSTVTTGSLTGILVRSDADGDALTLTASSAVGDTSKSGYGHRVDGTYGQLFYNESSGAYIFERDEAAINALDSGDTRTDTFEMIARDSGFLLSNQQNIVFTIVGMNDAPVLNAVTGATFTDNAASATGSTVTAGSHRGQLVGSDVEGDTLTYRILGSAVRQNDQGPGGIYTYRNDGDFGQLFYNSGNGNYVYVRNEAAINALNAGQNENDTFTISVSDGNLASATRDFVFTVVGADDAPVLNAVTGATITDSSTAGTNSTVTGSLTGTLSGTDVDTAHTAADLTFAASNAVDDTTESGYDHRVDGTYGKLYYNEGSGAYIFERDEAAINAVGATQNVNDTFTVSVSNGSLTSATRDLVFTVVGADDRLTVPSISRIVIEDTEDSATSSTVTAGSLSGNFGGTDVDGDAIVYGPQNATPDLTVDGFNRSVDGLLGTFYYHNTSGAYEFVRKESAINALIEGGSTNLTISISASNDTYTYSTSTIFAFRFEGANDRPTLATLTGATITDNVGSATLSMVTTGSLSGTLPGNDVDGDPLAYAANSAVNDTGKSGYDHSVDSTYGKLYYNEGSGDYIFERDEAAINALNQGDTENDTFTFSVSDMGGLTSDMQDLVFNIIGTDFI